MCGVIAFRSKTPNPLHLLKAHKIFIASRIRGIHAFGYSYIDQAGKMGTIRVADLTSLGNSLVGLGSRPPTSLIGHNRYSTSGDWREMSNNQPIVIRYAGESVSLVFNGVISQKTKPDYEKEYGETYVTENDGEIFLRKVADGDNYVDFVARGRFSFAGAWLNPDGEILALRNHRRPLYSATFEGGAFIASTEDIFRRVGEFKNIRALPVNEVVRLSELVP